VADWGYGAGCGRDLELLERLKCGASTRGRTGMESVMQTELDDL
jgi:hypothetical protein